MRTQAGTRQQKSRVAIVISSLAPMANGQNPITKRESITGSEAGVFLALTIRIIIYQKAGTLLDSGENNMKHDFIQTYSGLRFHPLKPSWKEIRLRDIAHALSNTCRFTGQCCDFYSVAEHSILMSHVVSDPLWGLLHDASEAYIADVSTTVKHSIWMMPYRRLEKRIMHQVKLAFGLGPQPKDLKKWDLSLLKAEAEELNLWTPAWGPELWGGIPPFPKNLIRKMSPKEAEKKFIDRFYGVGGWEI